MPTYGDVRTGFMSIMNRRDMTTSDADGFLQSTIKRIQRNLRIPAMEKSVIVALTSSYATNGGIFIPSDYLELRQLTIDDEFELQKEDVSRVVPMSFYQKGRPTLFARRGGLWVLAPYPTLVDDGTAMQLRIDYYAEFGSMTQPSDETVLTDIADDLMKYGALSFACDKYNDKRGDRFEARYTQIAEEIEGMGDEDETSGSAAVQPAYFFNDGLEDDE